LSTKYRVTSSGVSPAASRSRITPRIWLAISDGESATERFWQTTQRSWLATSWTACSFTWVAGCCAPAGATHAQSATSATSAAVRGDGSRAGIALAYTPAGAALAAGTTAGARLSSHLKR
jgi:hypothetical protein